MKRFFLGALVVVVFLAIAFMAGRWFERMRNGYHFEVLEEKRIESTTGPIYWRNVSEYVGFPVLVTNSTLIEIDGRLIYKAQRIFQESYPVADHLKVNNGRIEWDDREYSYSLKLQKLKPAESATNPDN